MYKVDLTVTAIPSLVTHSGWVVTAGLLVFDLHASRPAVHTVAGCKSRKNRKTRLQPLYNRIRIIL